MLHKIIAYIDNNWVVWLFAAITAIIGAGYRNLAKKQKEESEKNKAISSGMEALLRDRIIQAYNHYRDKGNCPIYAKENVRRMYEAYHTLGGNDVATKLKDELLNMPTDSDEKEI